VKPLHTLAADEYDDLFDCLSAVDKDPYVDYPAFSAAVHDLIDRNQVPKFFVQVCGRINNERMSGESDIHVLRNCPIDREVPLFDQEDPVTDKYEKKKTFVGEAFLELFAQLTGTPLLAYSTRNNGDFFHDVYAANRYSGTQTQKTDGELYFHNDRTAHPVRADFLALLGMRCPESDLVFTGYIDGRELLKHLSSAHQMALRQPYFVTPFDRYSRDSNRGQETSENHAILENDHSFRYYDTRTTVASGSPEVAKDALIALKDAIVRAEKQRHRILTKDLLVLANQDGLHSRDMIEINDPQGTRRRWLLKTYAFRDDEAAAVHDAVWLNGVRGRVGD